MYINLLLVLCQLKLKIKQLIEQPYVHRNERLFRQYEYVYVWPNFPVLRNFCRNRHIALYHFQQCASFYECYNFQALRILYCKCHIFDSRSPLPKAYFLVEHWVSELEPELEQRQVVKIVVDRKMVDRSSDVVDLMMNYRCCRWCLS